MPAIKASADIAAMGRSYKSSSATRFTQQTCRAGAALVQ